MKAARSAPVILCLVSAAYMMSGPCCSEFKVAEKQGTRVVVFLDKTSDLELGEKGEDARAGC